MNGASNNSSTATNLYVFDTFAFTAIIQDERAGDQAAAILADQRTDVRISAINAGEVFYTTLRERGAEAALRAERALFEQPRIQVVDVTWPRVRAAATLKAGGGISYADAFAAALAQELSVPLVTGDHEFERLEQSGVIRVLWLR
jgi:predicted nucleic acid-binding protein